MTTRRRLLVFGLFAGLLALGGGIWLLWPQESPSEINQDNAARIQTGMTLAEVEAILGGPARREGNGPISPTRLWNRGAKLWRSNHATIWVEFAADERVIELTWVPARYQNVSLLDSLRRWLRL